MAGHILVNPRSGTDDLGEAEVAAAFPGHRVVASAPEDLARQVRRALDEQPDFVGVAGGDGTVRSAAEILVGTPVPMLVLPAGTRNHFARQLGTDSLDAAVRVVADDQRHRVDVGEVEGRIFVNNASIGLYPRVVRRRQAHALLRRPRLVADLLAVAEQVWSGHRVSVEVEGEPHTAWSVFVGNGRYGDGLGDLVWREGLTDGTLDIRVVRADRPLARLRVIGALLTGRLARSPLVRAEQTPFVTVDLDRSAVDIALDGEVVRLAPPLRFRSRPGELVVLAPTPGDAPSAGPARA